MCRCLLCVVCDRALEGSADALIGHRRLPSINTSINNNQNRGGAERVVYTSAEFNYAAGSGESRSDISFAVNHGTEGTGAIQPSSSVTFCWFVFPLFSPLFLFSQSVCLMENLLFSMVCFFQSLVPD